MSSRDADPSILPRAVCAGCGCLCDDIELRLEGERVAAAGRACAPGAAWLVEAGPLELAALVAGQSASPEAASAATATALAAARAPLVIAGSDLTLEAALELARLGEALEAPCLPWPAPAPALLRSGLDAPESSATWGEVRATADLVVFWRCDPVRTHPRHLERLSLEPPLLGGEARSVAIVDEAGSSSETAARTRLRVPLEPGADADFARQLRRTLAPAEEQGPPLAGAAGSLLQAMLAARHVHLVLGEPALRSSVLWDELQQLAASARPTRRITISALPTAGNRRGVQEVLAWRQAAAPGALDARRSLLARAADLFVLAGLTAAELPDLERKALAGAAWISIGRRLDPGAQASLRIPGLDPRLRATVVRADGIHLTLDGRSGPGRGDPAADWLRGLCAALPRRAPCAS